MYIRKQRNQEIYNIYYPDGSIHSSHQSRQIAKHHLTLPSQLVSEGRTPRCIGGSIFSDFSGIKAIVTGSRKDGLPPSSREVLKKYGTIPIIKATLYRHPIPNYIHEAILLLSKGEKLPYDKYMHLGILLILQDGRRINVEKDYNVTISITKTLPIDTELKEVPLYNNQLTLNEIITNTRDKMGLMKFEKYEAFGKNCQNFVLNLMRANNIGDKSDEEFVIQDLSDLIKIVDRYPYLKKIINSATDTARAFHILVYGAGRKKYMSI